MSSTCFQSQRHKPVDVAHLAHNLRPPDVDVLNAFKISYLAEVRQESRLSGNLLQALCPVTKHGATGGARPAD